MTRFAIVQTLSSNGVFNGPLVETTNGPLYVRRIARSTRRGTWGMWEVMFSQEADKALTWSRREVAEKRAAEHSIEGHRVLSVVEIQG